MANYRQEGLPSTAVKVDTTAAAYSVNMRPHQVANIDLKGLGNFQYCVFETSKAKESLRGKLRPDRNGNDHAFGAGESCNIFDKLEDLFGLILPHLDHNKRLDFMTSSKMIFKHCQPAMCFLKTEKIGDGPVRIVKSRLQLTTSNKDSQKLSKEERESRIRNDMMQCVEHNPNVGSTIYDSLSIVQCHARNAPATKFKNSDIAKAHNIKQHGYMVLLMLEMIEIEKRIKSRPQNRLLQKCATIHTRMKKDAITSSELSSDKAEHLSAAKCGLGSGILHYPSQQDAGILVIQFVNLANLAPNLLKISALREFPLLKQVGVYNCAQFTREDMFQVRCEVYRSIHEAFARAEFDAEIVLDWSTGRTVMDNSLRQIPTFLAWLCFLYRGAKKLRNAARYTSNDPRDMFAVRAQNLGYLAVEMWQSAVDFGCMDLWQTFIADTGINADGDRTKLEVLQHRLEGLIIKHCRYPPPPTAVRDLMDLGKKEGNSLMLSGRHLLSDETSMLAIEKLACQMFNGSTNISAQRLLMDCDHCRHIELPEIFFSINDVKEFRKKSNKQVVCWGCRYDADQTRLVEEYYQPTFVANHMNAVVGETSINSIREYAHIIAQRQLKQSESEQMPPRANQLKEKPLAVFVQPTARGMENAFEYRDVRLSDPDLMKLLPEFARMCPHKLFMKVCPLGEDCQMGIPKTFLSLPVPSGAKPIDPSRVHPFIPAVCRCFMLNERQPAGSLSASHLVAHKIQAKKEYKPLYEAVLTNGRIEAHANAKLKPEVKNKMNIPFIMPDLRLHSLMHWML